jgi:hypothetical protein
LASEKGRSRTKRKGTKHPEQREQQEQNGTKQEIFEGTKSAQYGRSHGGVECWRDKRSHEGLQSHDSESGRCLEQTGTMERIRAR